MKALFCAALVALSLLASDASAVCGVNRGINVVNIGRGLRQQVIGNQLLTFDRNGNVVNRQFINSGLNRGLVNIGGFRSLQDRLIFGF